MDRLNEQVFQVSSDTICYLFFRMEAELVENAYLCEQQGRTRIELHTLQVALEQERLEKACAEKELADTRDALAKVKFE